MWQHALTGIETEQNHIIEQKYKNLGEKMDRLQKYSNGHKYNGHNNSTHKMQPKVINLTKMLLTTGQLNLLNKGPQYAMETNLNTNINGIIAETENAIKHMDQKWQNMYRMQTTKIIKRIQEEHKQNPLHKQQYSEMKSLRNKLKQNNIVVMKADKSKTLVLIDKQQGIQKVEDFLETNNITKIQTDPTTSFQKQVKYTLKNSPLIINNMTSKF